LQPARHRQAHSGGAQHARLHLAAGPDGGVRDVRDRHQYSDRPDLRFCRSEGEIQMSSAVAVSARPNALWLALRKNRLSWVGVALLLLIVGVALLAPWIAPHDPLQQNIAYRLDPPSSEYWLGTDSYGRDVLSRLMYGARISLLVG